MGKIEKEYNERVQELKKVKNIDNLVNKGGEGYSSHDDQAAALFNHYAPLIKKEMESKVNNINSIKNRGGRSLVKSGDELRLFVIEVAVCIMIVVAVMYVFLPVLND